ncbi:MAG: DUF1285 domain-containing protein [Syntrophobacter sp.]
MPESGCEQPGTCGIRIDEEGDWFHGETRIFRPEVLEALCSKLERASDGGYILVDRGAKCVLDVEDAPFVISDVDRASTDSGEDVILLRLKHIPGRETLDPGSLWVGRGNVLYCKVRNGRFPARFSRPAYYRLSEFIMEGPDGEFYIDLAGGRYPLHVLTPDCIQD